MFICLGVSTHVEMQTLKMERYVTLCKLCLAHKSEKFKIKKVIDVIIASKDFTLYVAAPCTKKYWYS